MALSENKNLWVDMSTWTPEGWGCGGFDSIKLNGWLKNHHDPDWKFKPYKAPKPRGPRKLTPAQRAKELRFWGA